MRLDELPTEIVADVLHHVSHAAISLWKCGSLLLNSKIAAGVTEMTLCDLNWTSTSRWPKMLISLSKLQSLNINRGSGVLMPSHVALAEQIGQLSPTLKRLELNSKDGLLSLFLRTPPQLDRDLSPDENYSTFVLSLGTLFPALEKLKVFGGDPDESICTIFALYSHLPPTLDYLGTNKFYLNQDVTFEVLPRGLKSWYTTLQSNQKNSSLIDCSLLPPSLTEMPDLYRQLPDLDQLTGILPHTLTSHLLISNWTLERALLLPPTITSLTLIELSPGSFSVSGEIWTKKLPRSLRYLISYSERPFTLSALLGLPPTLENLRVSNVGELLQEIAAHCAESSSRLIGQIWPPALHTLHLEGQIPSIAHLGYLPQTLKVLSVSMDPLVTFGGSTLPRGLEVLTLAISNQFMLPPAVLEGEFPESLTSLKLRGDGELIIDENLPPSLTQLDLSLNSTQLRWMDSSPLSPSQWPAKLRSLTLPSWHVEDFHALPRSLVNVSIRKLLETEEKVPRSASDRDGILDDLFSSLPPGIETFSALFLKKGSREYAIGDGDLKEGDSMENRSPLCKSTFSRFTQLKLCSLPMGLQFTSKVLRSLPSSLTSLSISIGTLEDDDLDFLPPFLTYAQVTASPSAKLVAKTMSCCHSSLLRQFPEVSEPAMARSLEYPDPRAVIHLPQ